MNRRPPYLAAPLLLALCLLALLLRSPRLEAPSPELGPAAAPEHASAEAPHAAPTDFVTAADGLAASIALTCGTPRAPELTGTGVPARAGSATGAVPGGEGRHPEASPPPAVPPPRYLANRALRC